MDVVVNNVTEVTLNRVSHARITFKDKEKWDFLLSLYGEKKILTSGEHAEEILTCFQEGFVELIEDMERYFEDLVFTKNWFTHRIKYDGKRIFTAIEDEPFEEIYNPNSKQAYRQAKMILTSHLQYCIESNEIKIRTI
jgi:hypothetical protein